MSWKHFVCCGIIVGVVEPSSVLRNAVLYMRVRIGMQHLLPLPYGSRMSPARIGCVRVLGGPSNETLSGVCVGLVS